MFRKHLMRQSRLLSRSLQQSRIQQSLVLKSLHTQTSSSRHATSIAPQLWRRWQSSDAQKPSQDESSQSEQKAEEVQADPLKKELEQKNREIIDLKVVSDRCRKTVQPLTPLIGQIPSIRCRVPQSPRSIPTRHDFSQTVCDSKIRDRPTGLN